MTKEKEIDTAEYRLFESVWIAMQVSYSLQPESIISFEKYVCIGDQKWQMYYIRSKTISAM